MLIKLLLLAVSLGNSKVLVVNIGMSPSKVVDKGVVK